MRVVIHGDSLDPREPRMGLAGAGLAMRGHEVWWHGHRAPGLDRWTGSPPSFHRTSSLLALSRVRADVVVGGGGAPVRAAVAGWFAGVHGMVLSLGPRGSRDFGALGQWVWETLAAAGIADATEPAPSGRDDTRGGIGATWSEEPPPIEPDSCHPDVEVLERCCERVLAGRLGSGLGAAAFLDRDGTLVVEKGYLARSEDLELLPRVPEALHALRAAGYRLVLISNQSGVGRGLFPLTRVYEAMARLRALLRSYRLELDAVYFCPHRPDMGCECRKPRPELLRRAADNLGLSLPRSVMFGDKLLDVATGHNAGSRAVLLRTGYGRDEEQRLAGGELERPPEAVADDLAAAAEWLAGEQEPPGRG